MSHKEHKEKAPSSVNVAIITVSDSRSKEKDYSGLLIKDLLQKADHKVYDYMLVKDDIDSIRELILKSAQNNNINAVILSGGTGISSRDSTFEVVDSLLEKKIDGFGELFRYLSYKEIGSSSILSRAAAGTYLKTAIISIPGSKGAVKLAMEKIILPEIAHMVYEIMR